MFFDRIKRWFLLRKSKELEKEHVSTEKEIRHEHREFVKMQKDLEKSMKR